MTTVARAVLNVKSPAFENNKKIPFKYSCDGANMNPPMVIENLPENTVTMALVVDDPDAPGGTFDHWIMWNIPPMEKINENSAPGVQGKNSRRENKYSGPCPPGGVHHYHFKFYALDTSLNLPASTDKKSLLKSMESHIIAEGELIGLYER